MNIAAITPQNPACFGVCCSVHDRCARYAMVHKAPASAQFIGMCYDPAQTDYPLFLEKTHGLPALRNDAREPGPHAALPEVPVLRGAGDMAGGALAPATGRECGPEAPDAGRVDGVGTPGNRLEAAVESGGHAAGATATITEAEMTRCARCGYAFDQAGCGYHGCPNCLGEGLQ